MGGDFGPRVTIPAAISAVQQHPQLSITLIGSDVLISPYLSSLSPTIASRLTFLHAPDSITMDEKPASALRHKRQSSLWQALSLLQQGQVDACVSAGNTGAMMAIGKHVLGTHTGVDRPALCKPVPTLHGHSYLLDLGANVNCTGEQLLQFAHMGSVLAKVLDSKARPLVALLSNGHEDIKGNEQVRHARELLSQANAIEFIGSVEGDGIFKGDADVIVCDGFVGNIALKASEGVAHYIATKAKESITRNLYQRCLGLLAWPLLRHWRQQFSPARYNGACFLGLSGNVIKSHGSADQQAFYQALLTAQDYARKGVCGRVKQHIESLQSGQPPNQ